MKIRIVLALILVVIGLAVFFYLKSKLGKRQNPIVKARPVNTIRGYQKLDACRYVEHRGNDGDSFHVTNGNRQFELRLYYVDAAETYYSDRYDYQRKRVAEQAKVFDLSIQETVNLGQLAKRETRELLKGKQFIVYTKWEEVFDGDRYYGFVQLPDQTIGNYLDRHLVENGLVRIHTRGDTTPDGQAFWSYRKQLEAAERAAKKQKLGGWGMK